MENYFINETYAIFSDGDRHGTSSSNSSSLSSPSSPSSLPDMLNDDDVNISGTGKIDGRLLPVMNSKAAEWVKNKIPISKISWNSTHLFVDLKCPDSRDLDYCLMVILNDFLYSVNEVLMLQLVWQRLSIQWCLLNFASIHWWLLNAEHRWLFEKNQNQIDLFM